MTLLLFFFFKPTFRFIYLAINMSDLFKELSLQHNYPILCRIKRLEILSHLILNSVGLKERKILMDFGQTSFLAF